MAPYPVACRPVEILHVKSEDRDGLVHIALRGELDLSSAGKLQEELRRVEADAPPVIVLDLSKLVFLDSTGLRCLVTADERARGEGRRVVIVRGPDRCSGCSRSRGSRSGSRWWTTPRRSAERAWQPRGRAA